MICCCRYTFQRTSVLRLTFQNSMIWIGNQSLWYSLQANKKTHKIFISVIYVQYKFHSNNQKLQLIFITSSFLSFHSVWNPHKQTNRSIALHILLIQSQLCRYDTDTHITSSTHENYRSNDFFVCSVCSKQIQTKSWIIFFRLTKINTRIFWNKNCSLVQTRSVVWYFF